MKFRRDKFPKLFIFWSILKLFSVPRGVWEESRPIGNEEFYSWTIILAAALLLYAVAFRLIGG